MYWDTLTLKGLTTRAELNGVRFEDLNNMPQYENELRTLYNADIRCTILSNYSSDNVLYDIFYRLNSGSVPLSTQELRQVLVRGEFANYLIEITDSVSPIQIVLRLDGPDARLRDVEILLRLFSFHLFGSNYEGNLKVFLDKSMKTITQEWGNYKTILPELFRKFNMAITKLIQVFPNGNVGRKYTNSKWQPRFNKVLFEVEVYYFTFLGDHHITDDEKQVFLRGFEVLCDSNNDFRSSIESTTKTKERYHARFELFQELVNSSFGLSIENNPFVLNSKPIV